MLKKLISLWIVISCISLICVNTSSATSLTPTIDLTKKTFDMGFLLNDWITFEKFKDRTVSKKTFQVSFGSDFRITNKKTFELKIDWKGFSDRVIAVKHFDLVVDCADPANDPMCNLADQTLVIPNDQIVDFTADTNTYIIDKTFITSSGAVIGANGAWLSN